MVSLSLHIKRVVSEGRCRPLKISRGNYFSHNLFMDDILIFSMLCQNSWICLHGILERFQRATGLIINGSKSSFYHGDVNMENIEYLV